MQSDILASDARDPRATASPVAVRWAALDGLRGIAVLAVVAWHVYRLTVAREMDAQAVPMALWPLGTARLGVDVFFVLSGLLVVRSWHAARAHAASGIRAGWRFLGRRARRILPAYWVSLLVLVPLAPRVVDEPQRIFAFATLNQYVRFWLPEAVNPVTWSLTTEWHFYLLVPLVAWLLVRVGRWPMLIGCIALSIVWWLHTPFQLPSSFVFGRLDQFVAGAVVGELATLRAEHRLVREIRRPFVLPAVLGALVALGTYHGASLGSANHPVMDALLHPLFGLLTAVTLLRFMTGPCPAVLTGAGLKRFGTISFGLYLWHYPILDYGLRFARGATELPTSVSTILAVPFLVALAIAAATLSYVLVERPFLTRRTAAGTTTHPR